MKSLLKNKKLSSLNINEEYTLVKRIALLMLLFSISRVGFYIFNTEHFTDITFTRLLKIFGGGLKFDISAIIYINALYILIYLLPLTFKYKNWYKTALKYLFFISNGIALLINTIDFFYFDFILKRSTSEVFMFATEGNILTLIKLFLINYWYGPTFWLIQVFIMVFFYKKTDITKPTPIINKRFYISGVLWLIISLYFSIIAIRGGFSNTTRPITLVDAGIYTEKPLEMAIVLNTPFTIIRTLSKAPLKRNNYFTDDELEKIYSPVHKLTTKNNFKDYNVVIFIIESLSREHSGLLNRDLDSGTYEGYTPFLDSLILVSKTFTRAFANGQKSIDALPSITAGIPSMVNPYVVSKYASNRVTSIARLLKYKGYETAFFHGAPNGSMGFESFIKVAGYDKYFGMTEYNNDADYDGAWGIWDEEFFQFYADEMNKMHEPFHTALFSVSSHHPFNIPERYNGKFREGPLPVHIPRQYTDMALKKFFDKASKMPWYNNTIFVITADHSTIPWHDEYKTSMGMFSIPLVIYQPSNKDFKGMDTTVVQQLDIMPTILDYMNFDEKYISFGNNMLDTTVTHFAINYNNNTYQVIKDNYVLQFRAEKTVAVYNYIEDRLQLNNLKDKLPKIQKEMEDIIKAFIQQYNGRMIDNKLSIK